jgi:hypothetical protein
MKRGNAKIANGDRVSQSYCPSSIKIDLVNYLGLNTSVGQVGPGLKRWFAVQWAKLEEAISDSARGYETVARLVSGIFGSFCEVVCRVSGTLAFNSSSQTRALPSEGARQSPRGDSDPPDDIFGPFGSAERLN